MPKKLLPIEKVHNKLDSLLEYEKDRWNAGLSNDYFQIEEIVNDLKECYEYNQSLRQENNELRRYNERLKNENEALRRRR